MDSSPFSLIARPDNGSYDEEAPQLVMHFDFDHKNPGYLSKSGPFYPSEGLDIFSKANKLLAFLAISRLSVPLSPSSTSSLYHSPPIPYQTASSILYYNHPLTRLQSLPFIFLLQMPFKCSLQIHLPLFYSIISHYSPLLIMEAGGKLVTGEAPGLRCLLGIASEVQSL